MNDPETAEDDRFVSSYLLYLLAAASHAASGQFHAQVQAAGLKVVEWRVLACLVDRDGQMITRLADYALYEQSRLTRIIEKMQDRGLVSRRPDGQDRRKVRVFLTEAGRELLVQAKAMGDAAQAISLVATGQSEELTGEVSISATELYSVWVLPPIIRQLRDIAPGITINVVSSNEISDLRRREADIAIRNTRPKDPDLFAKSLGNDVGTFFASAEYLERLGPVTSLADLNKADFIGLGDGDRVVTAFQEFGLPVTTENFRANSASHFAHWHLAKAGLGLCVGPCAMGDADPDLHRVLPNEPLFEYPVWLVSHRELRTNPRIRLVWDTLRDMLPGLLRGVSK